VGKVCIVIEDSRAVARFICDSLHKKGYSVISVDSMEMALKDLKNNFADAMFLDLVLPGLSGGDAIRTARTTWPKAGIVAMTAGDSSKSAEAWLSEACSAGADLLLRKPFTEAQLFETAEDATAIAMGAGKAGHVLVVDDSRVVLSIARKALVEAGFRVTARNSMEDALATLPTAKIDCLLTDIFMPGMGGIEGIAMVRRQWPHMNVVAMSGGLNEKMAKDKALAAALKLGAEQTLAKPFRAEELVLAVTTAMNANTDRLML
jgi:CheY-like chemotaxis protein